MPRERNPRRTVLTNVGLLRDWTAIMKSVWGVRMTIYDPDARASRLRRPEERPENDAERWDQLAMYMEAAIGKAAEIRDYALERRKEVKEGKQW